MDTPDPIIGGASSTANQPKVTPTSPEFESTVPSFDKTSKRPRRHVVHQRAKPSYYDPDDSSDGGQDHSSDNRLKAGHTPHKVRPHRASSLDMTGFEIESMSVDDPRLPSPDKHGDDAKATDSDPEGDQNAESTQNANTFFDISDPIPLDSPMSSNGTAIRGFFGMHPSHGHETSASSSAFNNETAKLPSAELKPSESVADDDQNSNPFSLSAVPPSRGASPPTNKARRKAATNKRPAETHTKQPRKKNERKTAQNRKKPTTSPPKSRVAAPVEPIAESSSTSANDNGNSIMASSDVHEEEEISPHKMPLKADFKVLKSPVNPDVAATQDIVLISSNPNSPLRGDDDGGDGDFVPTSTESPYGDASYQPKTRAATRGQKTRGGNTMSNVSKGKGTNPEQREQGNRPATNGTAAEVKPKKHSKQPDKLIVTQETGVGKAGSKPKPKDRGNMAPGSAIPPSSATLKECTARQVLNPHVLGGNLQQKKDAVASKSAPFGPRQKKAGQMSQPDVARQADITRLDGSRKPDIVAFDQDGPKTKAKSQKSTNTPILRASGEDAPPASRDEVVAPTKYKPMVIPQQIPKQKPTLVAPKMQSRFGEQESPSLQRQANRGNNHGMPAAVADQEHSAPESAYEDRTCDESVLSPTFNGETLVEHCGLDAHDWGADCVDDRDIMQSAELLADDPENCVGASNNSNEGSYLPRIADKGPSVPKETNNFRKNDPGRSTMDTHASKRPLSTVAPSTKGEPLRKKPRPEAVHTASKPQDEDLFNNPVTSRTLAGDDTGDVFNPPQETVGQVKETSFVRRCIRDGPKQYMPTRIGAGILNQNRPNNQDPAAHRDERAQPFHSPDGIKQRMFAAISIHQNPPQSPHDGSSMESGHDGNGRGLNQALTGNTDDQRRAWKREAEPYGEGLGEVLHKAVNVILRGLKSKEDAIDDVVDDYGREGGRIVDKISAKHAGERKKLVGQYEQYRSNYLQVCIEARRRSQAATKDLKSVKLDQIMAKTGQDPAIDRLKELQKI